MKNSVQKLTRVVTIVLGILILFLSCFTGTYHPSAVEEEHFISGEDAPTHTGQKIKVLNWNIQFMAGNTNNHYFSVVNDHGLHRRPLTKRSRKWRGNHCGKPGHCFTTGSR